MRLVSLLVLAVACSEYAIEGRVDVSKPQDTAPEADAETAHEETFEVEAVLADLVFFGDTSSSMSEELAAMGGEIEAFVARLEDGDADWQLAAVTGPDGCNQGGIFTPDTLDLAAVFGAGIATQPGEDEVDEWGLHNATVALESSDAGECNEGLVRDGSNVQVIVLSDEGDHSPGWDGGDPAYWSAYVSRMTTQLGSGRAFAVSSVTGDDPDGCMATSGATAGPGTGYLEATTATLGSFVSICGEWAAGLGLIAEEAALRRSYTLALEAFPESVTVAVNREVRSGWVYDPATWTVRFTENPPRTGDTVTVRYEIAE